MFTPLELQKQQFKKKLGGYKKSDVDEFFALVANDYESLYKENIRLKDKTSMLESLVDKYKAMEDTMQSTLVLAQRAADDLNRSAQDKARAIVEKAQMQSDIMHQHALDDIRETEHKKSEIRRELLAYTARVSSLLDAQKKILEQILNDDWSDNDGLRADTQSSADGFSDEGGASAEGTADTFQVAQ